MTARSNPAPASVPRPSASAHVAVRWALLVSYVVLSLWRAPAIIWPGRFWGEEGSIYFREAYLQSPLQALLTSNLGYYSLLNKLAALAAAHAAALDYAPIATMLFALAVQVLPAALLLFARIPALPTLFHRAAAVALVLFVQPNQEVWLNTINSQYYLCVAAGIILISAPATRATHGWRLSALVLAGLTGIVSCLLLPLFILEYRWSRQRHKLHETIALSLACVLQATVVLTGEGRAVQPVWELLPLALAGKQWVLPLFGYPAFDGFIGYLKESTLWIQLPFSLVLLLPYAVWGIGTVCLGNRTAGLLLAAALGVAAISLMASLPAQQWESFGYSCITGSADGRYYYAPNVFLGLSLLTAMAPARNRAAGFAAGFRAGAFLLLMLLIFSGVAAFRLNGSWRQGPSWPAQVRDWRAGKIDQLAIWPAPWKLDLRPDPSAPE